MIGILAFCCLAILACRALRGAEAKRPNIVFILTDDQNFDTIGCFGSKVLTPHLDRLAKEGVKFTRAYSVSSVCTPSRYICLTGQYASRCQSQHFLQQCPPNQPSHVGFNVHIEPGNFTVARVLKEASYATGFVGKWHTGWPQLLKYSSKADMRDPKVAAILAENQKRMCDYVCQCGFDYAARVYRGNIKDHALEALKYHNPEWITEGALEFLDKYKDRPFFLHVCTTLQHGPSPLHSLLEGDPLQTPAGLLKKPPQVQPSRASVVERVAKAGVEPKMAHATWLDDCVGAVIQKLEDLGLMDNTAIIMFSDNGTRNGKGTDYEGGAFVPSLMYWNGHIQAGSVCNRLIANIDFTPTILDICGVKRPADMIVDGRSFVPLVTGESSDWRDSLLLDVGHTRGIVTQRWKYIALRYPEKVKARIASGGQSGYHMDSPLDLQLTAEKAHPAYWDGDQLYDLTADPDEKVNLAKDSAHADVLKEMQERLRAELLHLPRPFGEFRQ